MKTRGMTLEQRAEWVANATRPALHRAFERFGAKRNYKGR